METNSGVTVIGAEAPSAYPMAPRTENANQIGGGSTTVDVSPVSVPTGSIEKKKRGKPRRYGPDGTMARALSPMPISSSVQPRGGEFSSSGGKRGRQRGRGYQIKHHKGIDMENLGAICLLSANGVISNVTHCQPDSSGGTQTYEGRIEILSLSGSFMPTETRGTRNRYGVMSVSLASADGRVVGGGVAGLLIAASLVQVVVGSFLPGNQHDQKPKKQKKESIPATVAPNLSIVAAPASNAEKEDGMDVVSPQQNSNALKPNLTTATSWRELGDHHAGVNEFSN